MECYACDLEAVAECPRCGALFCDDHGEALCSRCTDPNLALPSYRVYRGSLLALLVGSVFAVWLLVLPPDGADSDGPPASLAGVLSAVPSPTATPEPTPVSTGDPTGTSGAVVAATPAPAPTETATPTPVATAASGVADEYIVQPGDSMSLIAARFLAPGGDPEVFLQRIVDLNGISDPSNIAAGQVIEIPAQ